MDLRTPMNGHHRAAQPSQPLTLENAGRLLTLAEAAGLLGISERLLWGLTQSGKIPSVKLGRCRRIDPADLRAWLAREKENSGQR